jgi:hypothetical protein
MTLSRFLLAASVAALVLVGLAGAAGPELHGSVGPGYVISLTDASGNAVNHLDPGAFSLTVDDKSTDHNFHLSGPGVDVSTTLDDVGQKTFQLNLVDGKYTFICDAHPTLMADSFTVGTPPPDPTPTPHPTPKPTPAATKLVLTVTGSAVKLTTSAGKAVKTLKAGPAVITVRDRSARRGGKLSGAGVSRSTKAAYVGTVTWKVTLRAGTLVYSGTPVLAGGKVKVS